MYVKQQQTGGQMLNVEKFCCKKDLENAAIKHDLAKNKIS